MKTGNLIYVLGFSLVASQSAWATSQAAPHAPKSKQTHRSKADTAPQQECESALPPCPRPLGPGPRTRDRAEADKAALRALKVLPKLASDDNVQRLGFEDLAQVKRVQLGVPMEEYMVRLDELSRYEGTREAGPLFHRVQRVTYPLQADGRTRSAVEVIPGEEGWTAGTFGGAGVMRALAEVRAATAVRDGRNIGLYFKATIPALNLVFVGITKHDGLFLTPVVDSPQHGLAKGQTLLAEQVLARLSSAARKHNGLPG